MACCDSCGSTQATCVDTTKEFLMSHVGSPVLFDPQDPTRCLACSHFVHCHPSRDRNFEADLLKRLSAIQREQDEEIFAQRVLKYTSKSHGSWRHARRAAEQFLDWVLERKDKKIFSDLLEDFDVRCNTRESGSDSNVGSMQRAKDECYEEKEFSMLHYKPPNDLFNCFDSTLPALSIPNGFIHALKTFEVAIECLLKHSTSSDGVEKDRHVTPLFVVTLERLCETCMSPPEYTIQNLRNGVPELALEVPVKKGVVADNDSGHRSFSSIETGEREEKQTSRILNGCYDVSLDPSRICFLDNPMSEAEPMRCYIAGMLQAEAQARMSDIPSVTSLVGDGCWYGLVTRGDRWVMSVKTPVWTREKRAETLYAFTRNTKLVSMDSPDVKMTDTLRGYLRQSDTPSSCSPRSSSLDTPPVKRKTVQLPGLNINARTLKDHNRKSLRQLDRVPQYVYLQKKVGEPPVDDVVELCSCSNCVKE